MKYSNIPELSKESFLKIMSGSDENKKVDAIISCGLYGDIAWVREPLILALEDQSDEVRGAAAISLGHLFRRYKTENFEAEHELLAQQKLALSKLVSKIDNALDDYSVFQTKNP